MTAKARLIAAIDRLSDDEAVELESVVLAWRDHREWLRAALSVFAAHFDENEVEYTLADARPRPK